MLQLVVGKIGKWSQRCYSLIPCKPSKQHFFVTFFLSILTVLASLVMVLILLSDSFWYVLFSARNFDFKSCIALVWVLLITVTSPSKSFILDSCWFWRFCKIQIRRCHWVISSEMHLTDGGPSTHCCYMLNGLVVVVQIISAGVPNRLNRSYLVEKTHEMHTCRSIYICSIDKKIEVMRSCPFMSVVQTTFCCLSYLLQQTTCTSLRL